MPRRLLRVGLALTSTVYTLRPDLLLAKSAPDAGTSSPSNDWLGESGVTPFVPPAARAHSRAEVFFIDAGVADPEAFWLAVPKNATVVSIPAGADSWEFMAQAAEKLHGLAAIHIVSHGEHGALILNGRRYAAADLAGHLGQLRQLGRALTKNGDIFLYGCEAGAGREGQALLDTIAAATGADVAASSGDIGSKAKGGHWDLEVTTGPVDRSLILDAKDMAAYDYVLDITTLGALNTAIGNANIDGTDDTITISGEIDGTSSIPITTINKPTGTLTIVGDIGGVLTGSNQVRVLNIAAGSHVTFSNLTIENGFITGAGGNRAAGAGLPGGDALGANISNAGTLTISNCTITAGKAAGGGGAGGDTYAGAAVGAGGGGGGFGSTFGGVGGTNFGAYTSIPGPSAGTGQAGAGDNISSSQHMGGYGGTTSGGAGANYGTGYANAGNGGTANNGTISIGGGGGGEGYNAVGGRGGNAAGGIYNTGALTITGSSITDNIGAGGGGGGGASSSAPGTGAGGAGGSGVGGIWNNGGTLKIDSSSNTSLLTGNIGGAGAGGTATGSASGANGTPTSTISTTGGITTVYPSITSATYNASTGVLTVTGAGMTGGDTINVSDLTVTGEAGATYTLTSSNVAASNSTTFSVTLNATDKLNVNGLLNNNGTASVSVTPYNLAGAAGWDATASSLADPVGNGITVSGVSSPMISSSTYNVSTHVLTVTGSNLVATPGVNNDITVSRLTLTGDGGATYTLTSSNVDVTSATSFSVTLNGTDSAHVETNLFNKNGTLSTSGTTYNLAAANGWDSDINNNSNSVATSSVTVNNVAVPTVTSATYDANTGVLVVTGTGLLSLSGAANDIVVSDLTISGDSTAYTLTSGSVDITNSTSFTVTLNGTDQAALASRLDKNGTSSAGSVTYNLAAASGWDAGADSGVNDNDLTSNGVTVSNFDAPPVVTTTGGTTLNYLAGAAAATIDGGVTVSDSDNSSQSSGTVTISTGFHSGDVLNFTNQNGITGSYSAGTLTLSGVASNANYATAFQSVTFSASTGTTPGNRTISFVVNDGIKNSAAATDMVAVTAPPIVTTDSGSAAFVAGDNTTSTPVVVDSGLTVADLSTSTLTLATVSITNFQSGEDVLGFTNNPGTMGNIAGSYNSGTGVLTLTSSGNSANLTQWQAALEAVTYTDTHITPNNVTRTISFSVTDNNNNVSNTATRTVTVADTDQTPIVTTTGGTTLSYLSGAAAAVIDGGVTVIKADNTPLASGTVTISSGFSSGDTLAFTNNPITMGNIAGSYNSGTHTLTLTSAGASASNTDWQVALRAVTFSSTSASYGSRTISFVVSDGTVNSAAATDTVNVTSPVNVTTSGGSAAFVAGNNTTSTPVVVDSGLTVTDSTTSVLTLATVTITGNFHSSEDVLAFTPNGNTGNIAGVYSAGTLTLSSAGNAALFAQWQAALRAVTYTDTAVTPNNATRTISFTVTDANSNVSNTATRTVTVADTDQTPIAATSGGSAAFVAGNNTASTPVAIDPGITVSKLDNTPLASATVSITGNFHSGEDVLAFTNDGSTMGNIVGSYNSSTGVLTLTSAGATANIAQWQAALRAVTYTDTAVTPNTATRTISFVVSDGTENSSPATRTVTVADTDQSPIVTTSGGSAAFVAGNNTSSTPVAIDPGITVSKLDNIPLASATVRITGNFHSGGEDVLAFTNNGSTMGNISASYNATTGVLTLTSTGATASLAQWQAALRATTYTDTTVTPNTATRTVSFTVTDNSSSTSNTATRTVTVADTDQSPVVTTSSGTTAFIDVPGTSTTPVVVDPGITVSKLDNTPLASGTVSITGNFHSAEDVLAFTNNPVTMGNIAGVYNSGTGVLTLTSAGDTATVANWQAALRAVTYADTSSSPNTSNRTVSFVVSDGTASSISGSKTVTITAVSATYAAPAPDGFASSTTGGGATTAVTVLTAANFRTQAQSSTPGVITVAGLLNLGATPVNVNSNKTIQGADANAGLVGNLNLASGVSNVIIRGLNLTNPGTTIVNGAYTDGGDGITISGATSVFITHCTFFDTANHAIEIMNGADNVTVSWCEFYYTAGQTVHRYSVLIGAPGVETAPLHVTMHHNFWSTNVDQQMPVATFGYVHLYSNDFDAVGNTSGTVSSDQAQLLGELNVYTGMANPLFRQNVNLSLPFGLIFAQSNIYTAVTGSAPDNGTDSVFTPTYSYEALPVSGVVAAVSAHAGNTAGASYTDPAAGTASITGPAGTVTSGTTFTLTAVPAGFTPVSYQWRVGNRDISGATTSAINVSVAPSSIPYIYTVAIGLASGDVVVSTPFTVTPSAPPTTPPFGLSNPGGGGAMSDWFLGALAMLAILRLRQRRRARV
ncbi:MAG TPA: DUF4347 domain-containing protein [Opitutaceae bacterium]|jgi:pectate lyase|nr:DUF4347 domain-containing protein [Opitutaceae bacterium]